MNVQYVNPFISGLLNVSGMLGLGELSRGGIKKREKLVTDQEVNIIIGLAGGLEGNVVLSMHESTACTIASIMMGGMPVNQFDLIPRSALCELTNMVAGNSVSSLEQLGVRVSITPPTLIHGTNLVSMISQVETLVIQFEGNMGNIELNIAIEN
ncbi:MAG: chemotaxis protein CheX [Syntrophomonadaceae bacterium]|jgi:chemotaxis protein CheX